MKCIATLILVTLALCCASSASAVPSYGIVLLGLDDLEHASTDFRYDTANSLNEAGQAIGTSLRFIGSNSQSAWLYDGATTFNIGLTGPEHTDDIGTKFGEPQQLNEAGQVRGRSTRYDGTANNKGQTAWLYNGTSTFDVGLTGPEHTQLGGYKFSESQELNEAGQVLGRSTRYNGMQNNGVGQSVWLYDGSTTLNIGLTGSEYTRNDGYKESAANHLNQAGQVAGRSIRYQGANEFGMSAWLYDGTTTIDVGPTAPEYARNDGYKYSYAYQLNEAGYVNGFSTRFNANIAKGSTAWLYNGTTTIDIGLTGPEHTRNDGFKNSTVFLNGIDSMNAGGQVIGHSSRYLGTANPQGSSAWLYDGVTTIDIGLIDSEHTQIGSGERIGVSDRLNEAGMVVGHSSRYSDTGNDRGTSAWIYDGATTVEISLTDNQSTRADGFRESYPDKFNEAGYVGGFASRFNAGFGQLGFSAWLYDGATTRNIGLTSPDHTRNDGYQRSAILELNEAGQVSGVSERYPGGFPVPGRDAWVYDPVLQQTFSMQLSTRSDGFAYSTINYLGEDGLALGSYQLYDAFDNYETHAYYFTVADGLHDLGAVVDGGLTTNGWEFLADALRGNSQEQILGVGRPTFLSNGQMAYLLTPVPEPSALLLAALGAIAFLTRRRF